jgi:hypothetical protein
MNLPTSMIERDEPDANQPEIIVNLRQNEISIETSNDEESDTSSEELMDEEEVQRLRNLERIYSGRMVFAYACQPSWSPINLRRRILYQNMHTQSIRWSDESFVVRCFKAVQDLWIVTECLRRKDKELIEEILTNECIRYRDRKNVYRIIKEIHELIVISRRRTN